MLLVTSAKIGQGEMGKPWLTYGGVGKRARDKTGDLSSSSEIDGVFLFATAARLALEFRHPIQQTSGIL
jgi:hypothetical protein